MTRMEIDAIYENGALKLPHELQLQPGQKVKITIHSPVGSAVERLYGILNWDGKPEDLESLLGPDNHPWACEQ